MTLREMKKKSNQVYKENRESILSEYFLVGYVSLLAQYLRDGFFSFFVSLFLSPLSHGYVKHSIRLIDEEKPILSYKDSLIGILNFPRVAPVYLVKKGFVTIMMMICAIPTLSIIRDKFSTVSWELVGELGNMLLQSDFLVPQLAKVTIILNNVGILLNIGLCALVYLVISGLLMGVPYIMELEDYSWSESFVLSVKMMKGHIFQYFGLCLSYSLRYMTYWLITGFLLLSIGSLNEFCMLFCMVGSLFLYIEIFRARFELSKYLFYKEIKEHYNQ